LEVSKKKVTSVSDIPPLKLPTRRHCTNIKNKIEDVFFLVPRGFYVPRVPSLLGWTHVQPMTGGKIIFSTKVD